MPSLKVQLVYGLSIEQFWQTASASTLENGDMEITATIDGKVKVVSEASIRRHLKLEYSEGISTLRTLEIFEQLALMGAEQRRNKPMTQAQQRTYMCNYIKNMGSHTLQQLKKLSFDEVKELFETTMKRVNTFTLMKSDNTIPKVVARSSKIDAEQELNQESSKRQKIGEGSEAAEESKDELSKE
ncbi:hypothetical protein Tco_1042244 [Tanacetum coccineum]|uniref:Uncharacterized protein n=1 Tax=Tanacetum coccineum TaxID=301880 RepID=A0ABQ5GJ86_9ASTR